MNCCSYVLQKESAIKAESTATGDTLITVRGCIELHLKILVRRIGVVKVILKAE